MLHAYEQASSYDDTGTVTTQFIGAGAHTRKASFTTAFVRSDGIRFDFRDEFHPRSVLWTSGDKVQSYDAGGSIESRSNLGRTLKYSEVPGLLVRTIPSGPGFAEMKDVRLAPVTESIDGHACWRVTGRHPRLEDLTLWIDQSTHVLRRTVSREHYEGGIEVPAFDTETTTSYQPVLNAPVEIARVQGPDPKTIPPPRSHAEPWIGVVFETSGARIARVLPATPAETSGILAGDEMVSVDNVPIADRSAFVHYVQGKRVGTTIGLLVRRGGAEHAISIELADHTKYVRALVGKAAPAFSASAANGPYPASLAALAGHVVVLDFTPTTARRCVDCDIPTAVFMSKLQDKYGPRGLRVVGVSTEDRAVLTKFAADQQLHYPLAHDDGKITDAYRISGASTVVVIDKAGIVQHVASFTGLEMMVEYYLK